VKIQKIHACHKLLARAQEFVIVIHFDPTTLSEHCQQVEVCREVSKSMMVIRNHKKARLQEKELAQSQWTLQRKAQMSDGR